MTIRKIVKDLKTEGEGFKRHLVCNLYATGTYRSETTNLNYDVEGWWGSPVGVRLEKIKDHDMTVEIHTSSGGQNGEVSGLQKVRNLIAVLKDAEKQILEAQ